MNNEEKKYIKLTPFKMQVLQSFPFIDADFDALTNYELLCKVVDYLNKTIDNVDVLNDEVEEYINKFNELKAYVDNYFDNLNVQEEINNKLDEMAEDGSLTNLIKDYVDPIYESYEIEINNNIASQNTEITNFKSSINNTINDFENGINDEIDDIQTTLSSLASGSPLVASDMSEMTDTSRIYVNTTDGKWYYYNGNSWSIGGTYQSSGISNNSIDTIMLKNESVQPNKIQDYVIGKNKFNKNTITMGKEFNNDGTLINDATKCYSDYIEVENSTLIYITVFAQNISGLKICEYDEDYNFLYYTYIRSADYILQTNNNYCSFTTQATTKYIRFSYTYYESMTNALQLEFNTKTNEYEEFIWYINNSDHKLISETPIYEIQNYKLPYIYNNEVLCNKVSNTRTAYYAGVECKENIHKLECNYIWSKNDNNSSGTLALIINPNGVDKISDITDLSLHITFKADRFSCDVFGGRYITTPDTYQYQRIISENYETPQLMDGETEHQIVITVYPATNTITIKVDNSTYTGVFIPDETITGLNQVVGKYGTFEHYCDGDMDNFNMPRITHFALKSDSEYMVIDNFDRENGQLNTTPTGQVYHLINNGTYRR